MTFLSVTLFISTYWHLILLFFIVAMCYASVGFGGGSSYLAILALASIGYLEIRTTALLCNIVVVGGSVFWFVLEKQYNWKKITPLILLSIPMAFVGGYLKISESFFFIFLGFTLLLAAFVMAFSKEAPIRNTIKTTPFKNAFYGGCIGFISGIAGIGGGIFLAPLLHLTNWETPKKIAAIASLFILVNSLAGILGQYYNPNFSIDWNLTTVLLITVFIGGQIGRKLSNRFFNAIHLKRATAILIAFVSIRILITHI